MPTFFSIHKTALLEVAHRSEGLESGNTRETVGQWVAYNRGPHNEATCLITDMTAVIQYMYQQKTENSNEHLWEPTAYSSCMNVQRERHTEKKRIE